MDSLDGLIAPRCGLVTPPGAAQSKTYRFTVSVYHSTNGMLQTDVDISSVGLADIAKTAERLKGFVNNGGAIPQARGMITSTANLRVWTSSSLGSYTVVAEFEIEVNEKFVVQRITTSHVTGAGDYCAETNESITSVEDSTAAEAINNGCTSGTSTDLYGKVKLTSTTTLNRKDRADGSGVGIIAQSLVLKRAA